jgi:ATP-dependent Clp protease ATP-binding subunit ClpA
MMVRERFTKEARQAVVDAVKEAERERAPEIAPRHLLLALLGSSVFEGYPLERADVEEAFRAAGRKGGLSDADTAALKGLGIDVDQIVDSIEQSLGEGALAAGPSRRKRWVFGRMPFGEAAQQTLVRGLREAKDLGHKYFGEEHLVLGLLSDRGLVAEVLAARGVDYSEIRKRAAAPA